MTRIMLIDVRRAKIWLPVGKCHELEIVVREWVAYFRCLMIYAIGMGKYSHVFHHMEHDTQKEVRSVPLPCRVGIIGLLPPSTNIVSATISSLMLHPQYFQVQAIGVTNRLLYLRKLQLMH